MRLVLQLVAVAAVAFVGGPAAATVEGNAYATLGIGLATAVLALLVYAGVVRWSERRPVAEVALKGAVPALGRGMLIGVAMFGCVIANVAFIGGYRVDGFGSVEGAAGVLGFMAAAAVTEELFFRGVLFRIIERRIGTWAALVLTGVLFGLSHLFNPDATLWGALAIAIEAGGMFAAVYAATRNLWVPIGLHFGWNFAQGGVFGAAVSGNGESEGLLNGVTSGPTLLTGGDFGPEASLYAVLTGVAVTIVFLCLARRRGTMVPRRRRTARDGAAATLAQ